MRCLLRIFDLGRANPVTSPSDLDILMQMNWKFTLLIFCFSFGLVQTASLAATKDDFQRPSTATDIRESSSGPDTDPINRETLAEPLPTEPFTEEEKAKLFQIERDKWGRHHFGIHLIGKNGNVLKTESTFNEWGLGFLYSYDADFDRSWDGQLDLYNSKILSVQLGQRNYFSRYERLYLPYWKLAVGSAYNSDEGFSTFFDLKRISAFALVGLADIGDHNKDYYLEMGLGYALIGFQFHIQGGYTIHF